MPPVSADVPEFFRWTDSRARSVRFRTICFPGADVPASGDDGGGLPKRRYGGLAGLVADVRAQGPKERARPGTDGCPVWRFGEEGWSRFRAFRGLFSLWRGDGLCGQRR